jgi:predicted secreted protein with PEFG-CTERM motif
MNQNLVYLLIPLIVATPATAFAEISLSSYYDVIDPEDRLLVTGHIEGSIQEFKPVQLTITDPDGNIVYEPELKINDDGSFKYMIAPTLYGFDSGEYVVTASHEDLAETATTQFTVNNEFEADMEPEVVPEFGAISVLVLAVAVISIIAITSKKRGFSFNL